MNDDQNPYSPPLTSEHLSRPPLVGAFTVGSERHLVEVHWASFGLEVYCVDGREVLRMKSYAMRGERELVVGHHQVVIKLDLWPSWRILLRPWDWIAEAYVDGQLAVEDVAPLLRARHRTQMVRVWILLALAAVLFVGAGILWVAMR